MLKNVRAGIMPPAGKPRPSDTERRLLEDWIKYGAFGIEPTNPDPGRVTVRRLNRVEYRNTIRDLMGVDYDTSVEFPPDDSGHGFDNIADVLTLSPLLLEKYLAAAKSIVSQVVPMVPRVVAETKIAGRRFRRAGASNNENGEEGPLSLSYYEPASVKTYVPRRAPGPVPIGARLDGVCETSAAFGPTTTDAGSFSRRTVRNCSGRSTLGRMNKPFHYQLDLDWTAGEHELAFALEPLTPGERQLRSPCDQDRFGDRARALRATILGPARELFPLFPGRCSRGRPGAAALRALAAACLRPQSVSAPRGRGNGESARGAGRARVLQGGRTFEAGIAQAMAAVLASPMFLFREEGLEESSSDRYPLIDEYALASRLSYFLWSSMPDAELFRLAEEHALRKNLSSSIEDECSPTRGRGSSSGTLSGSGCRRATSRRSRSMRSP